MIWGKLSQLLLVMLLVNMVAAQYKYVFYDGDEAEYYGNEDETEGEDTEYGEEYSEDYYEYEYTEDTDSDITDQTTESQPNSEEKERKDMKPNIEEEEDNSGLEDTKDNEDIEEGEVSGVDRDKKEEAYDTDQADKEENENSEGNGEEAEETENYEDEQENYRNYDDEESYKDEDQNYDEEYAEENEDSDYDDEDVDRLYANYEILSEFYQKHFVDLRILDETCDPVSFPAPTIMNGIVLRYEIVENVLLPGKMYRQAIYQCDAGYALSSRTSDSMFCQEYGWTGLEPDCEKSSSPAVTSVSASCGEESGCSQECRVEGGEAVCYCSEGFLETSSGECEDIDECREDNGGCDEECINKPGSYMCACPSGYELREDNHGCQDANECLANNGHGPCQDTCVNMGGYYYCGCDGIPGTELGEDKHSCSPIDMCQDNNGDCSHDCYSSQGEAYCTCPQGLELEEDWKTCRDVDECQGEVVCEGECVNTLGSYTCVALQCEEGYEARNGECLSVCGQEEIFKDGSCLPRCGEGFQLKGGKCLPRCGTGYEWDGGECVQVCEYGFVKEGEICVPVCGDDNPCGSGTCVPREDYHECECQEGYQAQDQQCVDIDECAAGAECGQGHCVNTEGSYSCQCDEGFRSSGDSCEDVDECEESTPCSQTCTNTPGSYKCSCQEGFLQLPGSGVCKDIDECNLKPAICEHGCQNFPGGFKCVCNAGFDPDPEDSTKCISSGCSVLAPPEGGVLNCSPGDPVPGSVCRLECERGFVRRGKMSRKCLENGNWEEGRGWCKKATCPSLSVSDGVQVYPPTCLDGDQPYKQKCKLTCPPGFDFHGSKAAFCGKRNQWVLRSGPASCTEQSKPEYTQIPAPPPPLKKTTPAPPPYIVCPPDIHLNLTGPAPMLVRIPKPKTNVDWEKDVRSYPDTAKSLSYYQEPGVTEIKFEASSSVANQVAFCKVVVTVRDTASPVVEYCPQSRSVFLEPGQKSQRVFWKEPTFTDNVKIEHVIASALPGQELTLGKHLIVYQAADKQGNKEKCVFTITVVQFRQELPGRKWVLCRVGNTGRQIRLLVTSVPRGCRQINIQRKM